MEKGIRAVVYARYSSDKQDESSIDAQVRACREYAESRGYLIREAYVDEAISGKGSKTTSRKAYQRLLKDADSRAFDVVLIHKYDRIARNLREHANLEKRLDDNDITLIAVAQNFGNSSESKIMKSVIWAMSEYYIDNLSSETKKGMKETALKALHTGGVPPFGYDVVDKKYVINDLEAAYVKKMFACAKNHTGYGDLIAEMKAAGIKGKRGAEIKRPSIYEILRNEKYTGVFLWCLSENKDREKRRTKEGAIRIEDAIPQIIDKDTFWEVQEIMSSRKQTGRKKAKYLCGGLVYCGICGAKMHATTNRRKGHEYPVYYCSAHCGVGVVAINTIDQTAKKYLKILSSDENVERLTHALKAYIGEEKNRVKEFNDNLKKETKEKQNQIDNLMSSLASGVLPTDIIADIGNKITELKSDMQALSVAEPPQDFTAPQIEHWFKAICNAPDDKAVRLLIERIDATKTVVNVTSTLTTVLGKNGCGSLCPLGCAYVILLGCKQGIARERAEIVRGGGYFVGLDVVCAPLRF